MRKMAALLAGAALMLITTGAMATPISGNINFAGTLSLTGPEAVDTTQNATGIDFLNVQVQEGSTGTYATIPSLPTAITPVTFNDFEFASFTTPLQLWTLFSGSTTYSFLLNSVDSTTTLPNSLLLNGIGILSATGYEDTLGTWSLTTQDGADARLTFSSTAAPVPEPGTMVLLGAGFLGLAIYGKRRKNA